MRLAYPCATSSAAYPEPTCVTLSHVALLSTLVNGRLRKGCTHQLPLGEYKTTCCPGAVTIAVPEIGSTLSGPPDPARGIRTIFSDAFGCVVKEWQALRPASAPASVMARPKPDRVTDASARTRAVARRVSCSSMTPKTKSRAPFAFGGLWDGWKDPATGDWLQKLQHHHHRSKRTHRDRSRPNAGDLEAIRLRPWLDRADVDRVPIDLLRPYEATAMEADPVDPRVGNVRDDEPGLCAQWECLPNSQ